MNKSKIDWCDSTWNPITGCYHGCEYCYARKYANRFGSHFVDVEGKNLHVLRTKQKQTAKDGKTVNAPYPYDFEPTLHEYRLCEPARNTKPQTVFVCSMADMFGAWVPNEWIEMVFKACEAAPWHRYLFLTKNPKRYCELAHTGKLPEGSNYWYGSTVTRPGDMRFIGSQRYNTYVSAEPLLAPLNAGLGDLGRDKWIIIGAETGDRTERVTPKREWVDNIVKTAELMSAAVFTKRNLVTAGVLREDELIQQYPWEV